MVERSWPSIMKQGKDVGSDRNVWMDRAACKDWDFKKNGDPFFPDSKSYAAAKEGLDICAACPVRQACWDYSHEKMHTRNHGIFGGQVSDERASIARRAERADRKRRQQQG